MALSNVCPLRMAPPSQNPMKTHMQRRSWLTDRHHTHCPDPVTWATVTARRHKVVHQRGTIAQNHATTRAHQKTSSQHKQEYFLVCQSTHQHFREPGTTVDTCCSPVLQPTLTRTTNGNTSWALPKMLTKKHMSVGAMNFVKTHGVPTPAKTNFVSVESAVQRCANTKQDPHGTWHRHKKKQLYLALRYVTSRYCTEPYTQTLSVQ